MKRILLVDDDQTVLALEKLILTEEGYAVLTATNAKSALTILQYYDVDLVIADVMMPEMDGFRMVNTMRCNSKYKELPVAFFTAKNEVRDVVQAGKLQADLYITKPVNRREFLTKISDFFKQKTGEKLSSKEAS